MFRVTEDCIDPERLSSDDVSNFNRASFMSYVRCLVLSAIALTLVSCASDNDSGSSDGLHYPGLSVHGLGGEDPSQLSTQWYSTVRMYRDEMFEDGSFITVRPRQYLSENTLQSYIDFQLGLVDLDNCIVRPNGETDTSPVFTGSSRRSVSAGAEIFINTPLAPLYTINIDDENEYRINGVSPPLPEQATLMLPGDTFPTVAAYPIYDAEQPVNLTPGYETVTANSTYTWTAGSDSSSFIEILFIDYDASSSDERSPIRCDVLDDGEFELPQDALDYLASREGYDIQVRYYRSKRRLDYIDGVLFLQTGYAADRL